MSSAPPVAQVRLAAAPPPAPAADIVSIEPATGAELWRGAVGDVDEAVARARRGWPAWAAQPLATRVELVRRFATEVHKASAPLANLIARETGKPLWEARAEVEWVIARVENAVRAYAERSAQRRHDSALAGASAVRHKPHGVMAVLSPFNMPAHLAAAQLVPALIAGNVVVLKPSEKAPATADLLVRCCHRAGISASAVQMLAGGPAQGEALAAHDDVDGVLFTGSARVGVAIHQRLADRPDKIAALQMGGNNPLVIWNTPRVADAAAIAVQSAFTTAGQRCTAARRLIVSNAIADAVIAEIDRLSERLIVGAPLDDPAPFMGPVIDNDAADRLSEAALHLVSNGGRAIRHLVRLDEARPFLAPAIIDVTDMPVRHDRELFGPVLQIVRVDDFDAAIAEANRTRFGLVAALVGGEPKDYNRFWANVRAGIINWNRPTIGVTHAVPMGGVGFSGNHRPGGLTAADFSAYPVASGEVEQPRALIGVGLR